MHTTRYNTFNHRLPATSGCCRYCYLWDSKTVRNYNYNATVGRRGKTIVFASNNRIVYNIKIFLDATIRLVWPSEKTVRPIGLFERTLFTSGQCRDLSRLILSYPWFYLVKQLYLSGQIRPDIFCLPLSYNYELTNFRWTSSWYKKQITSTISQLELSITVFDTIRFCCMYFYGTIFHSTLNSLIRFLDTVIQ